MRKGLIAVLTGVRVIVTPSTAWATVSSSGNQYCSQIYQTPMARAKAYGNLRLKGPGDSSYVRYDLGGQWSYRDNSGPGGYWRAYIDGYGGLSNGGTYGWCAN